MEENGPVMTSNCAEHGPSACSRAQEMTKHRRRCRRRNFARTEVINQSINQSINDDDGIRCRSIIKKQVDANRRGTIPYTTRSMFFVEFSPDRHRNPTTAEVTFV